MNTSARGAAAQKRRGRRGWRDLSTRQRSLVGAVAMIDLAMRGWAVADLVRRPASQVHGPKALWGAGLAVVGSAGLLPAAYLVFGRRRP